jgi:hypothetical protein
MANTQINESAFISLFKEVYMKCFGHPISAPLSETESKQLANTIFDQTGLVIGVKSIKNYSHYIFNSREGKQENPSTATLDTFSRYILNAPYTDEIKRKEKEGHYPWWFQYRNNFVKAESPLVKRPHKKRVPLLALTVIPIAALAIFLWFYEKPKSKELFNEDFNALNMDSLTKNGWMLKNVNKEYWNKRAGIPGQLSLYTLIGDNWPVAGIENAKAPGIRNILVRKIESDCFTTEIHFTNFIPTHSWQQAGILLSEDSSFKGKSLRLTIGYNDFFGGYSKPPEIIIQAVGSAENGTLSKPEEIAHLVLFTGDPAKDSLIRNNLSKSSLKIEKKNNQYRFLYTNGRMESFAFKEAAHGEFNIQPKYIGIFAMQGFADTEYPIPALINSFNLIGIDCRK